MSLKLYGAESDDFAEPRASFDFGENKARFSEDGRALYIATLRLFPTTIRRVVNGGSLFHHLNGVSLVGHSSEQDYSLWTYVWGSFRFFEDGLPIAQRAILLSGKIEVPDLNEVMRHARLRLFDGRG